MILWTRLISKWPIITDGGCGFLIQAWIKFNDQLQLFARARVQWSDGRSILVPGKSKELVARYGLSEESLRDQLCTGSVYGIRGLNWMLNFNPNTVATSTVGTFCTMITRPMRRESPKNYPDYSEKNSAQSFYLWIAVWKKSWGFRLWFGWIPICPATFGKGV